MTDHGEQLTGVARTVEQPRGVGRSFADAWGAESPAADPSADPGNSGAGALPAAEIAGNGAQSNASHLADSSAHLGHAPSVTVTLPLRAASSAPGSTHAGTADRLTLEIRREVAASSANGAPDRIVVTVSLDDGDQQVVVTL